MNNMMNKLVVVSISLSCFVAPGVLLDYPERFDTGEIADGTQIKSSLGDAKWREFKLIFKQNRDKAYDIAMAETMFDNFIYMFSDAIDDIKYALEFKGKDCEQLLRGEDATLFLHGDGASNVPPEIKHLNLTRDAWVYCGSHLPPVIKLPRKNTTKDSKYIDPLTMYFRQWHYLLTMPYDQRPELFKKLHSLLEEYFQSNRTHRYNSLGEVFAHFSGQMARSYLMAWHVHHSLMRKLKLYLRVHKVKYEPFSNILLKFAYSWYVSEDQLIFWNLLRSAQHSFNRYYEIQGFAIRNYCITDNQEGDAVFIPYLRVRSCVQNPKLLAVTSKFNFESLFRPMK